MTLYAEPADARTVKRYLLAAYRVEETEVDEALRRLVTGQILTRGENLGSNAGFVGDEIAKHPDCKWVGRPSFGPDAEVDEFGEEHPTIEQATRMVLESLERRAALGLDLKPGSRTPDALEALQAVLDNMPGRLSSDEEALACLAFALWNGSRGFGVRDLAVMDIVTRREALVAIETWNRAIS